MRADRLPPGVATLPKFVMSFFDTGETEENGDGASFWPLVIGVDGIDCKSLFSESLGRGLILDTFISSKKPTNAVCETKMKEYKRNKYSRMKPIQSIIL